MSNLSSTSIQRPVLAIVMSLVIVLMGLIGFSYLGVREFPSVDPPIVNVTTNYTGASADVIENQITERLEESINGIAGIKSITSVSKDGRSTITVEFDLEIDIESAANDVRDRVARTLGNLPPDIDPPIVSKADADSNPILFITIQSDKRNKLELTEIAEKIFKEQFQTIKGVSDIFIWGEQKYSMRLWIDPDKLAAYQLTPLDVLNVLTRENLELPSGSIEGNNTELIIRTMGRLTSVEEFNNLIIKESEDKVVRFKDIGRAELNAENLRTVLKRDGVQMVGNAIVPQAGVNQVAIAQEVYKKLEKIKKTLPPDIRVEVGFDSTEYILASVKEVEETIITAFILVAAIIFLFLRDWRTTFIPLITIPISLIGAFFMMYLLNFSINVLTLLGIVLSIGLVVDDAIVVLENIYAKIEQGMTPLEASMKGSKEIFFAVVSTTIALATVFLPVIFLQGLTGRLFREFGLVVAGSVLISAFVSLTLTPMLSAKMLRNRARQPWFYRITEPFFVGLTKGYESVLGFFMRYRWLSLVIMLASGAATYWLAGILPSELTPLEDRNEFRLSATGPEGATFDYMDKEVMNLVELVKTIIKPEERKGIVSVTSPGFSATSSLNSGFVRAILVDSDKRDRSQQQIVDEISKKLNTVTGVRVFPLQAPTIGDRRGGLPVQYILQAMNFEKLREVLPKFLEKVSQSKKFTVSDVNLKFNKPEIKIDIDREKARSMGITIADVSRTLQLALSGQRFGYFIMNGKQYQVIGQLERANRNKPINLQSLYIKNTQGNLIQLDNVVKLTEQSTTPQLFRYNRFTSATVSAGLAKGVSLGEGIAEMDRIAKEVLDDSFSTDLAGQSKDFQESSSSLLFAFVLALTLIYLVLAAQFESFIDPLVIMLTVPLALAGALLSLWLFKQTLNVFSQIGIIMLIGLVTKNAILIVEFANQRREESNLSAIEAAYESAVARFRPILMTSLSTILGALPIALALGAGSESRVSMGIAIIGGLIFATLLTLIVIPALYSFFSMHKNTASNHTTIEDKPTEITVIS